jgi:hypothetical protein
MKKLIILSIIFFGSLFTACQDLDLPPLNVVQDKDLFSSDAGISTYISRIYSQMPFEDFKYSPSRGFFDAYLSAPGINDGASIGHDGIKAMTAEGGSATHWTRSYNLLRDANRLLEILPDYKDNFQESDYNHYIGEAYFARAMAFYSLAKRYGGIPLVLKLLKYPETPADELEIPRSTEEETWNQVLADFDLAIEYLLEESPKRGLANKYVAYGFKSEAMLFAGSVAKYNQRTGLGERTGIRVIGFDPGTAAAVSKKYFREAYNAAREVIKSGKYGLYRKKTGDREALYQNMVDMFSDLSSPENIFIKEYKYPDLSHGYDVYNVPRQAMGTTPGDGWSSRNNPTLDFVELFDGFEKNANGTIKVFDDNGKYKLFDKPTDLFKDAEPRLRAYVILPFDIFKGEEMEIRRGIFTSDVTNGIDPLMTRDGVTDYSFGSMSFKYTNVDAYTGRGQFAKKELYLSDTGTTHEIVTLDDGSRMNGGGQNGPFTSDRICTMTGFCVRKWLNPNMPQVLVASGRSEQPFILMRYGEILLNVAEAACELALAGETAPAGDDFQAIAHNAIKDIRERAGAEPLTVTLRLDEDGKQIIRRERRKELAFEHKTLWDIRRWRTQHSDKLDHGLTQTDGAYFRALFPFYSTKANKYFFDARLAEFLELYRFTEMDYYLAIPAGEVTKSPVIDQQPGR